MRATPLESATRPHAREGSCSRAGSTIVAVPYSASCSGVLSSPRDLWGGPPPVLTRTGPDPADHPVHEWRGEVGADALLAALREAGHLGDHLRDVRIVARTRDGIPSRIALDGLAPAEIDATTFRHVVGRRIGWDVLKSHAWEVTRSGRGYRFTGRGKGHGAGLCLRGASALAARGAAFAEVLATYAPGATLRATQDRVTLRVPSALTSEAPRLRSEILEQLADLRQRLVVTAPRDIAIEVHPTREAYQRATGRAWWTSASTRHLGGGPLSRRPRAAGRRRDSVPDLLAVLRHESVHVLTAPALADAPAWAAEGLAHQVGAVSHRAVARPNSPRLHAPPTPRSPAPAASTPCATSTPARPPASPPRSPRDSPAGAPSPSSPDS